MSGPSIHVKESRPTCEADDTATSKVVNVTELLEAVLLELPCKDILIAQRVSKAWKATIQESVKLQAALCFTPTEARATKDGNTSRERITSDSISARDCYYHALDESATLINPLLRHLYRWYRSKECPPLRGIYVEYNKEISNIFCDGKNASLRKMLVMQPPAKSIDIHCFKWSWSPSITVSSVENMENENGFTVADFLDHLGKSANLSKNCKVYFNVRRAKQER